jgi:phosphoribosyl-ATP pyrophosphohydrolase
MVKPSPKPTRPAAHRQKQVDNNPLARLWRSTEQFFDRFDVIPDVDAQQRVLAEEVREFQQAVDRFQLTCELNEETHRLVHFSHDKGVKQGQVELFNERLRAERTAMIEEAADVMVTVISTLMASGVTLRDLVQAMDAVIKKNDAKTANTHHLVNGKITRKVK